MSFHVKLTLEQRSKLDVYGALLREYAPKLGLLSSSDTGRVRARHIDDSLRAAAVFSPDDRTAYDLGSGAGLPGVVLAVALPACRFVLVESRHRRAGFLEMVSAKLELENVHVHVGRAEDLREPADVATARAFAPLATAWRVAWRLLRPEGRLIFFGGREMPTGEASRISDPAVPVSIDLVAGVANQGPLVIMTRG